MAHILTRFRQQPVLSSFLRHGPINWVSLRSKLSASSAALKSFVTRSKTQNPSSGSGEYSNMDSHPPLELGNVKSISTCIHSRNDADKTKDTQKDGIHLKYGIQQEIESRVEAKKAMHSTTSTYNSFV